MESKLGYVKKTRNEKRCQKRRENGQESRQRLLWVSLLAVRCYLLCRCEDTVVRSIVDNGQIDANSALQRLVYHSWFINWFDKYGACQ